MNATVTEKPVSKEKCNLCKIQMVLKSISSHLPFSVTSGGLLLSPEEREYSLKAPSQTPVSSPALLTRLVLAWAPVIPHTTRLPPATGFSACFSLVMGALPLALAQTNLELSFGLPSRAPFSENPFLTSLKELIPMIRGSQCPVLLTLLLRSTVCTWRSNDVCLPPRLYAPWQ